MESFGMSSAAQNVQCRMDWFDRDAIHEWNEAEAPPGSEVRKKYEERLGVPHHNNDSEAAIRILKVKTKVSGGFRTQNGADEFAVFHSIVETAKRNFKSKYKTLHQLIVEEQPDANFIKKHIV